MSPTIEAICPVCGAVERLANPGTGRFARHLQLPARCHSCEAQLEAQQRAESELAAERARERRRLELPAQLRGIGWEGFAPSPLRAARDWAAGRLAGLCVFGSVGVGKTWLAAAAAWEMVDRRPVRWVSVPVLLAQLMASFADAERAAALRAITGTGPLILDDLDKGNATDWTRQQLFAAIDGRVTAGAPLLITTNLPPSAIGERLGDPIMSRVVGYCQVVEIAGADRRLEAARRRAA